MKEKNKEIYDVFNYRYACKKFNKDKKVSDEDFATIIESARLSPSSFGLEPWKFLLLKNEKMKEDFKEFAWGGINSLNGASHIVIVLAKKGVTADSKHMAHMLKDVKKVSGEVENIIKEEFHDFQKNQFKLLENERALFDWASKQTYIALGNMMTTAAFLGIDSCAIEGFEKERAEKYLSEKGLLNTDEYGMSYMVSFGYRDEEQPVKIRQQLSEVFEVIE
ncbi:NAD(P)H-dependent oxidoreductase [Pseudoleptotrichia goodfellowii]|uniref:Nitroreductase family protein n=1 Tax=Pseudoleptotrichia goodfellowii F0264 TaxID=596323 RepID=D0GN98_9FUSO|nr:NAD(P)H-dependent oxidoreductase [Pseudoleptotrichia goodfellowii]EEY34447.1 nitroreductase family protein [Pseudoleptotrichia goodfellowii F0264]